jgi:putative spermidine/putrescine transport system permease protein
MRQARRNAVRSDAVSVVFRGTMFLLAGLTLVLLVAPTLVVLTVSFTDSFSLKFPPPGYSLRWYEELLNSTQLHFAAVNSLKVALATTVLAVLLGVTGALAIANSASAKARVLDSLFMSPLVLPALAFGFAALMTFSAFGWTVSITTLVIGHTVVCVPYVIRTTTAALAQMDPALLESSASLGARRLYTFRRVTWPLIRPGVMAGAFIAFMSSFGNVPVSLFLRDARTDMLPIRMWQDLEGRLDVTIAALSGVIIMFTLAMMIIMERATGLSRRLRS